MVIVFLLLCYKFEFMNPLGHRGMRTSLENQEGQPQVIVRPAQEKKDFYISEYTHQGQQNSRNVNMTVEELNGAKFTESVGYIAGRPQTHFTYGQGTKSNFIPPPPSRFMVASGHTTNPPSHPSQLPINSGYVHTVQTTQPLVQSVNRTFVPHHIINEIPIMASQTKRYVVEEDDQELNQADQRMLQQYEKLYGNYMEEKARSQHLERQLKEYQLRINQSQREIRQTIHTKEVERPKKIDVKMLASILMRKQKLAIDDIVERRKISCLNKLSALFADEEASIKTIIMKSSEEFVRVRTY